MNYYTVGNLEHLIKNYKIETANKGFYWVIVRMDQVTNNEHFMTKKNYEDIYLNKKAEILEKKYEERNCGEYNTHKALINKTLRRWKWLI